MKKILLTYPHSSLKIPDFIKSRLSISEKDLAIASDLYTQEFFLSMDAQRVFSQVHLFFGNLNRNIDGKHFLTKEQYGEHNGLFQSILLRDGRKIYKTGEGLTDYEKTKLLDLYYKPFYSKINHILDSGSIDYMFDIHSCDPISFGRQTGSGERTDIILGNLGDENGEIKTSIGFVTFSPQLMNRIKTMLEVNGLSVSLNIPFSGGNITQEFGSLKKTQVLQIEINKKLYLEEDLLTLSEIKFSNIDKILTQVLESL